MMNVKFADPRRSLLMASVQSLGGDRYRVRVFAGTDPFTGTERTVSRSFRAKGVRQIESMARRVTIELEDSLKEKAADHGTINELVTDWLRIKRRDSSPTTIAGYERHAARIVARFGRVRAVDLTGQMIDNWYDELLASGTTSAGIVHIHRVLRAALRWAYKKRGLPTIATGHASPPAHTSPEIRPPTTAAVVAILVALPRSWASQWARAVRLLVFTGMRRGEVVGLRWSDWTPGHLTVRTSVAEVDGVLHVLPPKGKRTRVLRIDLPADIALGEQRAFQILKGIDSPWVFPDLRADPTGETPRRPGWVSTMWGKWRRQNGVAVGGLHSLRHHYATMLLDGGVPINTVQDWLGHADVSTTLGVYGHRTTEGERQGLAVVRGALGSGTD